MHIEAHAGLGWTIGVLAPGSTPRLRGWCLAAGVLPDVDVVSFLFGPEAYMNWHHTFGHNLFLGAALATLAGRAAARAGAPRSRCILDAGVVALAFLSHLLTDMKLSAYPVELLWPLSRRGFEFADNWGLVHPFNTQLVYATPVVIALLALLRGFTPLEQVHPRLDRAFLNVFRRKPEGCATCARPTNERCDSCGASVCLRHASLRCGFRVLCPRCAAPGERQRNQAAP